MRLDRFLCERKIGTRSEVKDYLKKGLVKVDGVPVKKADLQITDHNEILFKNQVITHQTEYYFMLYKPGGIVTATRDKKALTVLDYFSDEPVRDLYPVGRLDKDTTGLLIITNDGPLGHILLSPKHHVPKIYEVTPEHSLSSEDLKRLENGVDIGDEELTLPAQAELTDDGLLHLTIYEGRYHQVKRMLEAIGNKVMQLKRISFGPLSLDESLAPGEYRALTPEEIALLKSHH